jgi:hypothetical protein
MCSKSLQHIQVSDTNDNFQSMPEIKVTILGTEKLLKNLDPTKATGPDLCSKSLQHIQVSDTGL